MYIQRVSMEVGGGEHLMDSMHGDKVKCTAEWAQDGALVIYTEMMGNPVVMNRRRISHETTHVEMVCGNVVAVRVHQDFSGVWKCTELQNMEALLEALDVPWIKRKLGAAIGFGVNRLVQTIKQDGNKIIVENKGGVKEFTNEIVVGAGTQVADSMLDEVQCTAEWAEDGSLIVHTEMMGKPVLMKRRRINHDTTHVEITSGDVVSVRVFTLQP
ncbi:hypothetical protein THRCLA_22116 [Thraustotheca clavata]|uniref:Uncharacterized protein n=1 Tax=Thraustotheca clavata TaxID=74557 RepID=A0A1V9ZC37_9STRA|nr:hypothetical protein THRCLA_22116 [Thraustotheca clavata]